MMDDRAAVIESSQADESVSKVIALASALETAKFTEFWSQAVASKALLSTGERGMGDYSRDRHPYVALSMHAHGDWTA